MSDRLPLIAACDRVRDLADLPPEEATARVNYQRVYAAYLRGRVRLHRSPSGRLLAEPRTLAADLGVPLRTDTAA